MSAEGSLDELVGELLVEVQGWMGQGSEDLAQLRRDHADVLTVALAGWMKAGKSTLLNALLGEAVAATDAGECTRVLTFYRYGPVPRAVLWLRSGQHQELRLSQRGEGAGFDADLDGVAADAVSRLEVSWPAAPLARLCLVDTPGLSSPTPGLSARTRRALQGELAGVALDAVIYLVRHLHPADLAFLEAFAAAPRADAGPVNALAVLARADELGAGHVDGMAAAVAVAQRYRAEPRLRRLVQTVVPVDARLACGAVALHDDHRRDLAVLAGLDPTRLARLLLSAELLVRSADSPGSDPLELAPLRRAGLVELLGLSGLRLAVGLVRAQPQLATAGLSQQLRERSGIGGVETCLAEQFSSRARLLKARATLVRLERLSRKWPDELGARLAVRVEALLANAAELAELGELNRLRREPSWFGPPELSDAERLEADRVLGGNGRDPGIRLGLASETPVEPDVWLRAATEVAGRWRVKAEGSSSSIEVVRLARVVVRAAEGLAAGAGAAGAR